MFEARQILLDGRPYLVEVYAEIFMDKDIAHRNNPLPRDFRVSIVKIVSQF